MRTLQFKRFAMTSMETIVDDYESTQAGLGSSFEQECLDKLETTLEFPEMYPEYLPGVRWFPLRRFPFCVYYRFSDEAVTVQAVLDARANPKRRAARLGEE